MDNTTEQFQVNLSEQDLRDLRIAAIFMAERAKDDGVKAKVKRYDRLYDKFRRENVTEVA